MSDLEDILAKAKDYLKDPKQLIRGPKSTGSRADIVKSWKEHCSGEGRTIDQNCPKKCGKYEVDFWDRVGTGEDVQGNLTLTWAYDCCNIYDADATFDLVRIQDANDATGLVSAEFSIPEPEPVELAPCKPCTPKCLRVQISVWIIHFGTPMVMPSLKRKMTLDIYLCPSTGDAASSLTDKTDYNKRWGDKDGIKPQPAVKDEDKTWGLRPAGPASNPPGPC